MEEFGILSNHGLTLVCIARDPTVRMRDIAQELGITERGAQRIVAELVAAGYLERRRVGRRNRYRIHSEKVVPLGAGQRIRLGRILDMLGDAESQQFAPAEQLHRQAGRLFEADPDWGALLAEHPYDASPPRLPTVDAALIATDLSGVIRLWNRQAERLYGWSREEALGRSITDLTIGPEDAEVADNIMRAVRQRGSWEGEFWVRRRNGDRFLAYVQDMIVRDRHGIGIGLVGLSVGLPVAQASRPDDETAASETDG